MGLNLMAKKYEQSDLAIFFDIMAALSFIAAAIGVIVLANGNLVDRQLGLFLLLSGTSGGFSFLVFSTVIECLHEIVFRLRNLERLTADLQNSQKKSD